MKLLAGRSLSLNLPGKRDAFPMQVTSAYVSPCVLSMVPEDTDLVLVEFTFNDSVRSVSHGLEENPTYVLSPLNG